ncbi:DUF5994 family protein [Streptomyces sp. NPDC058284]|uniref:DUF5994 family protein n=1 Tax=unclassified Streptomyces TaxID=2593676 RepID=UPI00365D9981
MAIALETPPPSRPLLRLRLAPLGALPQAIDGAWWPHSYDAPAELPGLLAGLPRAWGGVSSVTFNGAMWSVPPDHLRVADRVVRLHRSPTAPLPHTVVLLSPGRGRWDLLVVPPDSTAEAAEALLASVAGGDA